MELQKKAEHQRFNVEHRDAYRGLTDEQFQRLITYLKNGYDCLKVVDDNGVSSEVTVDSLIELLESNKKIREIIIERVSLNEATIHRLILEGEMKRVDGLPVNKILPFKDIKVQATKKDILHKAAKLESRLQSIL